MKYLPIVVAVLIAWMMALSVQTVVAEDLVQRSVEISAVTRLEIEGGGDLELRIGDREALEIVAPASVMEHVKVDAKGDVLRIRQRGKHFWSFKSNPVQYQLTLKALEGIEVTGAVNISVVDPVISKAMEVRATGASVISFVHLTADNALDVRLTGASKVMVADLKAESVKVDSTGAGNIHLAGNVQKQSLHLSGAAEYHAFGLNSTAADVHLSGASKTELWVRDSLELNISGSTQVNYYGSPKLKSKTSGASQIQRLGEAPEVTSIDFNGKS